MDRITTGNALVVLTVLLMVNLVLVFCMKLTLWTDLLVIQGLLLDVSGAIVIAVPDVPSIKKRATPENLRKGWSKLNEEGELNWRDPGFSEIISLIQENTTRIDDDDDFKKIHVQNVSDFGSRTITGSQDVDALPNWGLTETVHLERWIAEERDRKFRRTGLLLLGSGFSFQLISYALNSFVVG